MAPAIVAIDEASSGQTTPLTSSTEPLDQQLPSPSVESSSYPDGAVQAPPMPASLPDGPVSSTYSSNGTSNGLNGLNGHNGASARLNGNTAHEALPRPLNSQAGNAAPDKGRTLPAKFPPVAIIGMACRLPGSVSDPEDFYQLICRARSGWSEIPEERFSMAGYYHPDTNKLGCMNAKGACFLTQDIGVFDAPFFNITEREAISMDPQHRLILECTYEALENAGIPKHKLVGQDVGVYAGGSFTDYELNNIRDLDTQPMHQSTGSGPALMANRVSYYFDLRGPSHTVETACSSSLTALHIAMKSLQRGDSSMVVLASSHLNLVPDHFVCMGSNGLLSSDGRSYAFDSRGNGFGRGEGAGVVILKPLAEAVKDNDPIRAVILGSGVNQDGKTNGITMPSGESQLALMKKVYAEAGLDPTLTGYVEAHGTGTKVGDPIEMTALHKMFHEKRSVRDPLYVGSVKTNVGHLEGASGIASVIKSALMLERGMILPNYDFQKGNTEIPFDEWGVKIPTKQIKWPKGKKYVSVNSFGFGGGNAHTVLAAPPKRVDVRGNFGKDYVEPRRLFVVSAHDKDALERVLKNVTVYLERRPIAFQANLLANVAYTLGQRRSFLPYKAAIHANEGFQLIQAFATATTSASVRSIRPPKIGFVFTGQGAQWHAMGRELIASYPIFGDSIKRFDASLSRLGATFSMTEELHRDAASSRLGEAELSQPGTTAVQLALVDLLRSWDVQPSSVVGHSSGEIAAAYAASILSHEDCAAAAYLRGQAVIHLKASYPDLKGGMLAVGASPEDVQPLLEELTSGKVVVACHNSPGSITASGDSDAVAELQAKIEQKQLFNRKVRVETAYHSHHMELVAEWYSKALGKLSPALESDVTFFSSLRGRIIDPIELTGSYWVQNLTKPVLFSDALTQLCTPTESGEGVDVLIEIGPHNALEGPSKQVMKAMTSLTKKPLYMPSLVRNKNAVEAAMDLAGKLFCQGAMLDMQAVNFPVPPAKSVETLTDIPKYPWNHSTRYWFESRINKAHMNRKIPRNDVIGTLADWSNELEPTWRTIIRPDDMPWVRGHFFQDMIIYPMAGYLSAAIEAATQRAMMADKTYDRVVLRDVTISRPFVIQEGMDSELNITLRPYSQGPRSSCKIWDEFRVFSWNKDRNWIEHCRGLIKVEQSTDSNLVRDQTEDDEASLRERKAQYLEGCTDDVNSDAIYEELATVSAKYNAQFKSMENCRASDTNSVADVIVPDTKKIMPKGWEPEVLIHPAFLDQFTHATWPIVGAGRGRLPALFMPKYFKSLTVSTSVPKTPGDKIRVYGVGNPNFANPGTTKITMFATGMDGKSELIRMEDLTLDPFLDGASASEKPGARELCYRMTWEPLDAPAPENSISQEKADGGLTNGALAAVLDAGKSAAEALLARMEAPAAAQDEVSSTQELDVTEPIAIICSPEQEQPGAIASVLKARLESEGKDSVTTATLQTVDAEGRIVVVLSELSQPIISCLDAAGFEAIQKLAQTAKGILWVVQGATTDCTNPQLGAILGMARTIRSETSMKFATLDLDGVQRPSADDAVLSILKVAQKVFGKGSSFSPDMEYQVRSGALNVCKVHDDFEMNTFVEQHTNPSTDPFLQPFSQPGRPLKIKVGTKGALDSLHFVDDEAASDPLLPDQVSIEIKVTSMNFKDIMVSMGEVPSPYLGVESAGIINAVGSEVTHLKVGDRVAASSEGAYSTYARCKATSAVKIPDNMSLEDAATIPVVFYTAYYSLFDIGRLQKDEVALVHAGAGGVGQAAIMLCQMVGAEVYTTVGSPAKKTFLMETYGVPEDHIFYSRDTTFAKGIKRATKGRGVDIVLNSLAGDTLRATWECLAHFGRFVEIGKTDILRNAGLEMAMFENNATFASVDMTVVAEERPLIMKRLLDDICRLLSYGAIRPISPITKFPISDLETAFRTLQAGKVHGKVIVTASPEDKVKATYSSKTFDNVLRGDATYAIVGGTGGIGRSMTRWMINKGAKSIVLLSRSDRVSAHVEKLINEGKEQGATIQVRKCDVSDAAAVQQVVSDIHTNLPAIRGVVHSAMVLDDVLFEKMNFEQWDKVVKSKIAGCWNLHTALGNTALDFFITLSSVSGVIGNQGQAAYAAANTFLDSLVQFRRRQGLAATTLDLAAVSDTGYLAENAERQKEVIAQVGGEAISEKEILALIGAAITGKADDACQSQVITGLKLPATFSNVFWASDAKFSSLCERAAAQAGGAGADATATVSAGAALKRATSFEEAHGVIVGGLLDKTASLLMLPREELDPSKDTVFYGLDSLVSIELRNWITREFGASLQILDLLSSGSFISLAERVLAKTELVSFEKAKTAA